MFPASVLPDPISERTESAQDAPRSSSQHEGDLFVPEGQIQGIGGKGWREKEARERGKS